MNVFFLIEVLLHLHLYVNKKKIPTPLDEHINEQEYTRRAHEMGGTSTPLKEHVTERENTSGTQHIKRVWLPPPISCMPAPAR
jgi:hypothetical protein